MVRAQAIIDNIERMWFLEEPTDYVENYIVRGLDTFRIGFARKQ